MIPYYSTPQGALRIERTTANDMYTNVAREYLFLYMYIYIGVH